MQFANPLKEIRPNGVIDLTTMPSALLARRLRSRLWCQKQVVAGHRGRWATKMNHLLSVLLGCMIAILSPVIFAKDYVTTHAEGKGDSMVATMLVQRTYKISDAIPVYGAVYFEGGVPLAVRLELWVDDTRWDATSIFLGIGDFGFRPIHSSPKKELPNYLTMGEVFTIPAQRLAPGGHTVVVKLSNTTMKTEPGNPVRFTIQGESKNE